VPTTPKPLVFSLPNGGFHLSVSKLELAQLELLRAI
jgi:hypothetical protein